MRILSISNGLWASQYTILIYNRDQLLGKRCKALEKQACIRAKGLSIKGSKPEYRDLVINMNGLQYRGNRLMRQTDQKSRPDQVRHNGNYIKHV